MTRNNDFRNESLDRRQWLQTTGLKLATAAVGTTWIGGCAGGRRLNVFNWSDYIAPELITEFEQQHGARVVYDNYASDAELETKLIAGGGGYDVVFPSDRAMAALLAKQVLADIDKALLPNLKHLDAKFLTPPFDPRNQFSVPYFWGTLAVGIRADHVTDTPHGFEALFDERWKGRITMLDDAENVVAAMLAHLGLPLNSTDDAHLAQVKELLIQQRPLVGSYTSDAYKEKLISDEAWVALGWSGDLRQAVDENAAVQVVIPQNGTMIWMDSLAIPKGAQHVALAHEFINYLLDPAIAARNAEHVHFATPNRAALEKLPAELRNDGSIYPTPAVLDKCEWLQDRGAKVAKIEQLWREVRQ